MPTLSNRQIWRIVFAAAAILLITSGIRLSLGLFVSPISHDTGLNIVQISFALAMAQLMWGVSQPITGALADKYGAWWVLLLGTLLLSVGCALVPHLANQWGLVFTLGFLVAFGTGAGSFSVLMGQVASQTNDKQRGSAAGIINAGSSFGQFIFAPILQAVISLPVLFGMPNVQGGWTGAMYFLSGVSLLCLPLAWYITRGERAKKAHHKTLSASQKPIAEPSQLGKTVKGSFKNISYWMLHLSFFTCGFHIAFLVTHLPKEVSLSGLNTSVASWSLALIGLSNVIGSLFIGWCVGRYRSKYILFWMYFSRAVMIGVYLLVPHTAMTFYVFGVSLGLTWLATVPPTASLVGKLFGVRYLATLFGFTLFSHQIGGFLGAFLGGVAMDSFGNYQWMWYADIVLALFASLTCLPIKEGKVVRA